mmetsp:Transcript_56023/g.179809  ORF Transcript_56023/g.179809 Transcript_56023/m.179809 type:complete len:207 (-) Transcript_56023:297-917(-)
MRKEHRKLSPASVAGASDSGAEESVRVRRLAARPQASPSCAPLELKLPLTEASPSSQRPSLPSPELLALSVLLLRSWRWQWPKKSWPLGVVVVPGSAGLEGVALAVEGVQSPGAPRSMFCFARFKRFIISSAASFFSGSVSLSGWYCKDLWRHARVTSLAVAASCTPRMTWSASSHMVFTRASSVLKPFCLLSRVWPSQKTRTQVT